MDNLTPAELLARMDAYLAEQDAYLARLNEELQRTQEAFARQHAEMDATIRLLRETRRELDAARERLRHRTGGLFDGLDWPDTTEGSRSRMDTQP